MSRLDELVGQRVRSARLHRRMTQTQLAEKIGVTFQQVQKYENGSNRVSATRLWQIAEVFDMPISYFFEGAQSGDSDIYVPTDIRSGEVVSLFDQLPDNKKKAVLSFLRSVAAPQGEEARTG